MRRTVLYPPASVVFYIDHCLVGWLRTWLLSSPLVPEPLEERMQCPTSSQQIFGRAGVLSPSEEGEGEIVCF